MDWPPLPSELRFPCSLAACAHPDARFSCSSCRSALYDSPACQRAAWAAHKAPCRASVAARSAFFASLGVAEDAPVPPRGPARDALLEALRCEMFSADATIASLRMLLEPQASSAAMESASLRRMQAAMCSSATAFATSRLAVSLIALWSKDGESAETQDNIAWILQRAAMSDAAIVPLIIAGILPACLRALAADRAGRRHAPSFVLWRIFRDGRVDIVEAGAAPLIVSLLGDADAATKHQAAQLVKDLMVPATPETVTVTALLDAWAAAPRFRANALALIAVGAIAPVVAKLCAGSPDAHAPGTGMRSVGARMLVEGDMTSTICVYAFTLASTPAQRTEIAAACRLSSAFGAVAVTEVYDACEKIGFFNL